MRWTLKLRVWLTTLTIGIVVCALGLITALTFIETRDSGLLAVEHLQPSAEASAQLIVGTAEMERGISAYTQTERAESLAPFAEGATISAAAIARIRDHSSALSPQILDQLDHVEVARNVWINKVAEPMIAAIRAGNPELAETIQTSQASTTRFELLRAHELALDYQIDTQMASEFDSMAQGAQNLAITLILLFVVLLLMIGGVHFALRRDVLKPLIRLRGQLRVVAAGEFQDVQIKPSGPPEIRDVGVDAEDMRRQLVHQIDEAREAREELQSEAPVVNAIRDSLQAHCPPIRGVTIFGDQQSAEGLSGDWWEAVPLPDGRAAIIVTDVSGHGWPAGITGIKLKDEIVSTLVASGSADEALTVGVRLFEPPDSLFATVAIVIIDPAKREVQWANAGHLPPMIVHADYNVTRLDVTGPLLSTIGGSWTSNRLPISTGDRVILWTDGVTESRDADGNQLEDDGLIGMLIESMRNVGRAPQDVVPAVIASARTLSVEWERDDATLIVACLDTTTHNDSKE